MTRNLQARVAKLETAREHDELPSGGLLIVFMEKGETQERAYERAMRWPEIAALPTARRQKLVPVFVTPETAGTL